MRVILFIVALLLANAVFSQFQISGKVSSSKNELLPGASVIITESTLGQVTDMNGEFNLSGLKAGTVHIRVNYIGYKSHHEKIDLKSNVTLNIVLEEEPVLTEAVFVYASRAGEKSPFSSSIIKKEELASRNYGQDIPFLLSSSPSFVATSEAGAGIGYTNFRIRGTDATRTNVSINGVPLNDAESHGVFWVNTPDFGTSIDNVQIQRGVGTSAQGASAFGASINMQTNTVKNKPYAKYDLAAGSFSTIKNSINFGTGLMKNGFSFDARLSKINSNGYVDRAFSDLKSFFVSGGYHSENTIIKLNIFSGNQSTYQAWNGVPSVRLNNDIDGMKRYGEHGHISEKQTKEMLESNSRTYNIYTYDNETDNYQQGHYQLLLTHRFSEYLILNMAGHYTRGLGYYQQYKPNHKFSKYGLAPIVIGDTTIARTDFVRRKWLDNHFGGATFSLMYQKNRSDISLGGGWNHYIGDHYGDIIWARHAIAMDLGDEWYRNQGKKTDFNIYLKYNYALTNYINLYADMQYRDIDYSIEGIDDDLRDLTNNYSYQFLNPKAGLFYQVNEHSNAYLSWAIAHREPNRRNLTDADPNGAQPIAEMLNDFEAGYTYKNRKINASINFYYMRYKDQLVLTGKINDVGAAIMANVDNSYRAGGELSVTAQITPKFNWGINATLSKNQIIDFIEYVDNWDTGGQDVLELGNTNIAFSPSIIANNNINYKPFRNFEASLLSQYVGKQYIDNTSNEARSLNAYFVNNLRLSYSIHPKFVKEIEFSLLVNNLLNHEYESNAWVYSYLLGGERYSTDGYFPQAGINFLSGISIKF